MLRPVYILPKGFELQTSPTSTLWPNTWVTGSHHLSLLCIDEAAGTFGGTELCPSLHLSEWKWGWTRASKRAFLISTLVQTRGQSSSSNQLECLRLETFPTALPGWVPWPNSNRAFYKGLLQGLNEMFSLALDWSPVLTAETLAKHQPQFFIFLSVECGLVLRTHGGLFPLT